MAGVFPIQTAKPELGAYLSPEMAHLASLNDPTHNDASGSQISSHLMKFESLGGSSVVQNTFNLSIPK